MNEVHILAKGMLHFTLCFLFDFISVSPYSLGLEGCL